MANRSQLAEAYVAIKAETAEFDQKIAETEQSVQQFADEAESAATRAGDAFDGAGEAADGLGDKVDEGASKAKKSFSEFAEGVQADVSRQVGVLTGLVGAVAAVVGSFTLFLNAGKRIGEQLFNNGKRMQSFGDEVSRVAASLGVAANDADVLAAAIARSPTYAPLISDLEEVESKLAEIDARIAAFSELGFEAPLRDLPVTNFFDTQGLLSQRDELRREAEELRDALTSAARQASNVAAAESRRSAQAAADAERDTRLTALEDRIRAELALEQQAGQSRIEAAKRAQQEINEELIRLSDGAADAEKARFDELMRLSDALTAARIAGIEREEAAREAAARDAERAAEDAIAEIFADRLQQLQREGLDQYERQIQSLQDEIQELVEQREGLTDPDSKAVLAKLLEALNAKIDGLRAQQKDSALTKDDMRSAVREGVEQAIRNDLQRVSRDIINVQQGLRDVGDRL